MSMPRSVLRLMIALLSCGATLAVADDPDQIWTSVNTNGVLTEGSKWRYWFDGHARSRNNLDGLGVSIIRPALGYAVSDRLTLWAGYARVVARRDGPDGEENRYWQQGTFPLGSLWGGNLSGRTRLEQRTFEGADDIGHRIRQAIRWERPIPDTDFSWLFFDELFVGLNSTDFGQRSGYDQNRAYFGVAWRPTSKYRFELTYLNNNIDSANGSSTNHNLSLAFFF